MLIKYNNSLLYTFIQKFSNHEYYYIYFSEGKLINKRLFVIKKIIVLNKYVIISLFYNYNINIIEIYSYSFDQQYLEIRLKDSYLKKVISHVDFYDFVYSCNNYAY